MAVCAAIIWLSGCFVYASAAASSVKLCRPVHTIFSTVRTLKRCAADASSLQALALEDIHDAWKEVQLTPQTSSGVPAVWLDFKAPFAEPPPVLLPPKPQPGPEPEYQPPTDLQELPAWKPPVPQV